MNRVLTALLACTALGAARPAPAGCEMMQYTRVQATPHAIVFQAAEGTTGVVNGNVVVIMGRDASLVVDTGEIPSVAHRMVAEIRGMKAPPVRYILHTHWHGDHLLANGVFKAAWPEAKIIASSHTVSRAAFFYADYPAKAKQRLPILMDDLRKRGLETKNEEERTFLSRTYDCVEAMIPETGEMQYVVPDTVVDGEMTVDLGGLPVEIRFIGVGNTPGDLVAWVPSEKLIATGDMLVAPVPYAIGSDLVPWAATLDRVEALHPAVIVPGHGPVMKDDQYLRDVRALIASIPPQIEALRARGIAKAEAPGYIDAGPFAARYITTPMRRQAFDQFFVKAAISKAWPAEAPKKPAS